MIASKANRRSPAAGTGSARMRPPLQRLAGAMPLALIVLLAAIIYSNTLHVPFVFDDRPFIIENPAMKDMRYYVDSALVDRDTEQQRLDANFRTRIVTFFTFALNYRLHGLNVEGYHAVNLLIHCMNGLLVYWLVAVTFRTPFLRTLTDGQESGLAALCAALLFVSHPVQTQAVTYVAQRFTSLATCFYLLSLVMYVRARLRWAELETTAAGAVVDAFRDRKMIGSYGTALLSAVLAMHTKEISFTLPVAALLYEYLFFEGPRGRRVLFVLPLLLSMLIIPWAVLSHPTVHDEMAGLRGVLAGEGTRNPAISYLYTQFRVIVTYVRLLILPVNQNIDYYYPRYSSPFDPEVAASFLFLVLLLVTGGLLYRRSSRATGQDERLFRLMAFGIFWFFLALSVESSVLPLNDLIFEHRLYLPSVGIFLGATAGLLWVRRRMAPGGRKALLALVVAVIGVWSATAYARNGVWGDILALWEDNVRKSPEKARPHHSLGSAYLHMGRAQEAIRELEAATRIEPTFVEAYKNLGIAYAQEGKYERAELAFQRAISLQDDDASVHSNLGLVNEKLNRIAAAEQEYLKAISMNGDLASAHSNLGLIYLRQNRDAEAVAAQKNAVRLSPDYPDFQYNLGVALERTGDVEGARTAYQRVLSIDAGHVQARQRVALLSETRRREVSGTSSTMTSK